jgi:hypothetical protein
MRKIRKNSVNFHGEMVLLENYSNINYTGTWLAWQSYAVITPHFWKIDYIPGNSLITYDLMSNCDKLIIPTESVLVS